MKRVPIFQENTNHTTYVNKDGIIVPSTTTILKMINKEELLYWANSLGFKRKSVKNELEISAYIGSTVHHMIEEYTTIGTYDFNDITRSGIVEKIAIKNAFISFLKFYIKEKNNLKYVMTEKQLSGKRHGGTLDALVEYDGLLTLTDYKTSKAFYPTMILQLGAYDILLREILNIKVDQYMVLLLDKKEGNIAKTKIVNDKEEMKEYRIAFKKLSLFYRDWIALNQVYWQ